MEWIDETDALANGADQKSLNKSVFQESGSGVRTMNQSTGAAGGKGAKKNGSTFVIDCRKSVEDKITDIASLEKFLQERIKVGGGKASTFDDAVTITRDKSKITVTSDGPFSKRYFKLLGEKVHEET